jgi:hypothetical protein
MAEVIDSSLTPPATTTRANPVVSEPVRLENVSWDTHIASPKESASMVLNNNSALGVEAYGITMDPSSIPGGGYSFWAAVFNFLNSIVGAGIIGAIAINCATSQKWRHNTVLPRKWNRAGICDERSGTMARFTHAVTYWLPH